MIRAIAPSPDRAEPRVEVRLVVSDDDLRAVYPVMSRLRSDYTEASFLAFVREQLFPAGAQMIAGLDGDDVLAAATFRISASLAWRRFIYVDDLVTRDDRRSRGYGAALLAWLTDHGQAMGCGELHLDSGVQRHDAHRFYLRERMDIVFYHFRKVLA